MVAGNIKISPVNMMLDVAEVHPQGVTIAAEVHPAGVTIAAEVHPAGVTVAAEVHPAVVTIAAEVHPAVVTIAAEVHPTGVIIAAEVHLLAVVLAHAHRVIFVGQMNVSADPERTLLEREENPEDDPRTEESIDTKRLPVHLDQSDALKPFSHRRNSTEQTAQHPSFVLILWNKSPFVESVQCAVQLALWCQQVGAAKVASWPIPRQYSGQRERRLLIKGGILGESAEVELLHRGQHQSIARFVQGAPPSPYRRDPSTYNHYSGPSCAWIHIDRPGQLHFKGQAIRQGP